MDHAALVRIFERFGDLFRLTQNFVDGNRTLRDTFGKRRPLDQLHHEGWHRLGIFESVNRRNMRMI